MNRKSHSGVFMMEMTAVVFFFILCAGICIQTFVKADSISREAADLNRAVFLAQSTGEVFKANGRQGLMDTFSVYGQKHDGKSLSLGFDKNGNPCEEDQAVFIADAEFPLDTELALTVKKGRKELYTLTVKRHESKD
ncbi:hypothetical protein [Lacrimispora sp. JR3]|uniref:hypothetical protein n=1 Tax=Lacrimispora sinapis TaxID=3111456 RepID=UPI003748756E